MDPYRVSTVKMDDLISTFSAVQQCFMAAWDDTNAPRFIAAVKMMHDLEDQAWATIKVVDPATAVK